MGNKSSRVTSPLSAIPCASPSPFGRPSGSLYTASAVSNPNYGAPSPAERGMLYCKTKDTTPAPALSGLYGKKSKTKSSQPLTPTSLYSKPSAASTPTPTPTHLYSKNSKGSLKQGFGRSSFSRSGVSLSGTSIGRASAISTSRVSDRSAGSRSVAVLGGGVYIDMNSCVKCRLPFGDSAHAFCRDCGHPRPAGTKTAQRLTEERNSFRKHAVAF